ncbi:MAG: protein translocase subunit SecD [Bacilli bacterium]|nr:protein translocase subunit SecD [Bacilli bacterium]
MIKWGKLLTLLAILVVFFAGAGLSFGKLWHNIPRGLDIQGGFEILYQIDVPAGTKVTKDMLTATQSALENRISTFGVKETNITVEGNDRVRIQLAGVNEDQVRPVLGKPAVLEFRAPDTTTVLLTGSELKSNAQMQIDQTTNQIVVAVEFKDPSKFAKVTQDYLNQNVGIYLDGKVISNPTIQSVIAGGKAQITGMSSPQQAQNLANLLNAGSLPYPLKELSSNSVGASLGQSAFNTTIKAGLIALALIVLFMIVFYRIPGLIACIALAMYVYLLVAIFAGLKVDLTMPGVAALILGVGMAVDVNIIAYERIKDEFHAGKSLLSAITMGQRKSLPTIIDAETTSIIAGILMLSFGAGTVHSFAIAHLISIVTTFITAVMLSRWMLSLTVRSNLFKNPWWFGAKKGAGR